MILTVEARPTAMRAKNLADHYGLPTVGWTKVTGGLQAGLTQGPGTDGPDRHTCWLTTINPDGSPHVTGVGALWDDGAFWFQTGETTRKGRNLARDPRCALSVSTREFDLVVEGDAHKITAPTTVQKMASRWAAQGWPASVDESGLVLTAEYSAPSAGSSPWSIFRIEAHAATALAVEAPGGATRWVFDGA